jgi:acyl-CoA reductase-like NAD-dependent aldehyde dehydrogenase
LAQDSRVSIASFTGSANVGFGILKNSTKQKVLLELGGDASVILDKSNITDEIIDRIVYGSFVNSGQVCISIQKILVILISYESLDEVIVQINSSKYSIQSGFYSDSRQNINYIIQELDSSGL